MPTTAVQISVSISKIPQEEGDTNTHLSLCWMKTFLCLGFVFLWVRGETPCSLCHTWFPWGCYGIPRNLRRGRCSKPIKTQMQPSSLEVSQNALSLLPCLEGGNSDGYSSCGQHEPCCWWGSWKKKNTENSVRYSLCLLETVASFCTKSKCLATNWIHPSNILRSLCCLASSKLLFRSFPHIPSSKHSRPEHGYINYVLTRLL